MAKYVKVLEYASQKGIHERTVYRRIANNEVVSKKIKGVLHVKVDEETKTQNNEDSDKSALLSENSHLKEEVFYLRDQLEKALSTIDSMQEDRQRSDTIIMQLTRQLETKQKQLSDVRDRSLWRRFKVALGFS